MGGGLAGQTSSGVQRALQHVPVQHHSAQQPSAEGPKEVVGCCGVVRLDHRHVTWGDRRACEEEASTCMGAQDPPPPSAALQRVPGAQAAGPTRKEHRRRFTWAGGSPGQVGQAAPRPAARRLGKRPSLSRIFTRVSPQCPRQTARPTRWAGPLNPARPRPHISPVPVRTLTFCVLPSLTATCFSTLTTSSQAPSRP